MLLVLATRTVRALAALLLKHIAGAEANHLLVEAGEVIRADLDHSRPRRRVGVASLRHSGKVGNQQVAIAGYGEGRGESASPQWCWTRSRRSLNRPGPELLPAI